MKVKIIGLMSSGNSTGVFRPVTFTPPVLVSVKVNRKFLDCIEPYLALLISI